MATMAELITQAEAVVASKRAVSAAAKTEREALIAPLAATESLTPEAQARFDQLTADKRAADTEAEAAEAKVAELRKEQAADDKATRDAGEVIPTSVRTPAPAVVSSEKRTYTKQSAQAEGLSFFSDLYRSQFNSDFEARDRIERHRQEVIVEGEAKRSVATGALNSLVPPTYLLAEAALLARAGRPTANIVRHEVLPDSGMSIIIPRGTTGTTVAIQATQNSAVSNTDIAITDLTVPVVTIAGQQDVSRQSLERGIGVDSLIYGDLAADYAVKLDAQVLNGSGSSGEALGILKTASIAQATAFTAAATVSTFYTKLAGAVNSVQTARYFAPNAIIMHPRRWSWLIGQTETSGRPLITPNANGPFNSLADFSAPSDTASSSPVGSILGINVFTDASIPGSVGTGPEDQVIVARLEDLVLWEQGDGTPTELRFEQTTGGSLTTKLVAYGYAAFTAGRYPSAVAVVGGNAGTAGYGLIAPTF